MCHWYYCLLFFTIIFNTIILIDKIIGQIKYFQLNLKMSVTGNITRILDFDFFLTTSTDKLQVYFAQITLFVIISGLSYRPLNKIKLQVNELYINDGCVDFINSQVVWMMHARPLLALTSSLHGRALAI